MKEGDVLDLETAKVLFDEVSLGKKAVSSWLVLSGKDPDKLTVVDVRPSEPCHAGCMRNNVYREKSFAARGKYWVYSGVHNSARTPKAAAVDYMTWLSGNDSPFDATTRAHIKSTPVEMATRGMVLDDVMAMRTGSFYSLLIAHRFIFEVPAWVQTVRASVALGATYRQAVGLAHFFKIPLDATRHSPSERVMAGGHHIFTVPFGKCLRRWLHDTELPDQPLMAERNGGAYGSGAQAFGGESRLDPLPKLPTVGDCLDWIQRAGVKA